MKRLQKKGYLYAEDEYVYKTIPITEIFANRDSVYKTLNDIEQGRISHSSGPLECWLEEDTERIILVDGYHRLVEGVLKGQSNFSICIIGEGYSDYYRLPSIDECLFIDMNLKYMGLEDCFDAEILDELVEKIK